MTRRSRTGKAPSGAFFCICLFLFCVVPQTGYTDCLLKGDSEPVSVKYVVDGDTLVLADSTKVRLIGINTPELSRRGRKGEPLSGQARDYLKALLSAGGQLRMQRGEQEFDRYGRLLAHLFLADGRSVEAEVLASGLGFHVAIPPNLDYLRCFQAAELQARRARVGVWADSVYLPLDARQIPSGLQGFTRIQGLVEKSEQGRSGWWVALQGDVVLHIQSGSSGYFDEQMLRKLPGKQLVVRGWLLDRSGNRHVRKKAYKAWMMTVRHPAAIEIVTSD